MHRPSLLQLPVAKFLEQLASATPTPGGGSVAALTGAQAAALGQMVAGYTLGRPKFAAVEPQVLQLVQRLREAGAALRRLVDEDAAAYEGLNAALKLDRSDPTRKEQVAAAARRAAEVPLETAAQTWQVRLDIEDLSRVANPHLRSDAEAAISLACGAMQAAAANVRANLRLMGAEDARVVEERLRGMGL